MIETVVIEIVVKVHLDINVGKPINLSYLSYLDPVVCIIKIIDIGDGQKVLIVTD